ncbi:DUF2796 domain-containing protein [Desulfurivibrio dismutans]|uniref:DUF2796 domain-containing protein n=1 Tax=Desulfurivibrio dismutans TaxID=1398908 RepID=UPI0023DB20BE|nr:DUF2796 domain-containing protein [Desulfurivibrio alkaliphilus]MDF1614146.1 DUF2796 domain-containing protein [Desulfurivibrio alkaliphilus]
MMPATVPAHEHHDHDHQLHSGHGAHVHGRAEINLIVEETMLVIDLLSPAMNLVGFEHQPRNHEQRAAIKAAKELLSDGKKLFALPATAHCRQVKAEISSDFDLEHSHEHRHDHGHQQDHEPAHHDHDHADFTGLWEFHCEQPASLTYIDFRLFEHFPATQRLRIQAITPAGQTGAELRPQNARLDL